MEKQNNIKSKIKEMFENIRAICLVIVSSIIVLFPFIFFIMILLHRWFGRFDFLDVQPDESYYDYYDYDDWR